MPQKRTTTKKLWDLIRNRKAMFLDDIVNELGVDGIREPYYRLRRDGKPIRKFSTRVGNTSISMVYMLGREYTALRKINKRYPEIIENKPPASYKNLFYPLLGEIIKRGDYLDKYL